MRDFFDRVTQQESIAKAVLWQKELLDRQDIVQTLCHCNSQKCQQPALTVIKDELVLNSLFSKQYIQKSRSSTATVHLRRCILNLGEPVTDEDVLALSSTRFFRRLIKSFGTESLAIEDYKGHPNPNRLRFTFDQEGHEQSVIFWVVENASTFDNLHSPEQFPTNLSELCLCLHSGVVSSPRQKVSVTHDSAPNFIVPWVSRRMLPNYKFTPKSWMSLMKQSFMSSLPFSHYLQKEMLKRSTSTLFAQLLPKDAKYRNKFASELYTRLSKGGAEGFIRNIAPFCPVMSYIAPSPAYNTLNIIDRGLKWIQSRQIILHEQYPELRLHMLVILMILARTGPTVLKSDEFQDIYSLYVPSNNVDEFIDLVEDIKNSPHPIGQLINDIFDLEICVPCKLFSDDTEPIYSFQENLDITFSNALTEPYFNAEDVDDDSETHSILSMLH